MHLIYVLMNLHSIIIPGAPSLDSCRPDYIPTLEMGYGEDGTTIVDIARYEQGIKRKQVKSLAAQNLALAGRK